MLIVNCWNLLLISLRNPSQNVSVFFTIFSPRSGMSSTSPVTLKFLLLKWIFIQGEGVKNFTVSRLFYNFVEERVCLNDFENCYLCEEDSHFFGDLLIGNKYAMWVEVIENPKGKENTQSAFLTVECRDEKKYFDLKELLEKQNFYGYREVASFPWM